MNYQTQKILNKRCSQKTPIEILNIPSLEIEDILDLSQFENLQILNCRFNNIKTVDNLPSSNIFLPFSLFRII